MASATENVIQLDNSKCRICLFTKHNLCPLFRRGLSMKVMKLADIKMYEGDGLPSSICLDCELEVKRSTNFIAQIQRADAKWREILAKEKELCGIDEKHKELSVRLPEKEDMYQVASTSQSNILYDQSNILHDQDNMLFEQGNNYHAEVENESPMIEIEEFNVKQEIPSFDQFLSEKEEVHSEGDHDHYGDVEHGNDQPEDENELNPLDHVDIVEDRSKGHGMELSNDPLGQEEPLIETQRNENETSVDPLTCMKQEVVAMDIDKDTQVPISVQQPAVSGPSSSVKKTPVSIKFPIWPTYPNEQQNQPHSMLEKDLSVQNTKSIREMPSSIPKIPNWSTMLNEQQNQPYSMRESDLSVQSNKNTGEMSSSISKFPNWPTMPNEQQNQPYSMLESDLSVQSNKNIGEMSTSISMFPNWPTMPNEQQNQPYSMLESDLSVQSNKNTGEMSSSFSKFPIWPTLLNEQQNQPHSMLEKDFSFQSNKTIMEMSSSISKFPIWPTYLNEQQNQPYSMQENDLNAQNNKNTREMSVSKSKIEYSNVPAIAKESGVTNKLENSFQHSRKLPNAKKKILFKDTKNTKPSIKLKDKLNSDKLYCFMCDRKFDNEELFLNHKENDGFICRVCMAVFKCHSELETHIFQHKVFKCKTCKEEFICRKKLKGHRQKMHTLDPVQCIHCNKMFTTKTILANHILLKHSNSEESYKCIVCGNSYKFPFKLKCHLDTTHIPYEHIECSLCHNIYLGPVRLKAHVKTNHLNSDTDIPIRCPTCGKVFGREQLLSIHLETHDDTVIVCEICGLSKKGKTAMKCHMNRVHPKKETFVCPICNEQFNTNKLLRIHHNKSHYERHKPTPVFCEICGKAYKTLAVLKKHKLIHSDERPFKCDICGASFKQDVTLSHHSRVHSNVGKFCCSGCDKTFRWKQTFDRHVSKCVATDEN